MRFLEHEWTENVYQARSAKFKENNQIPQHVSSFIRKYLVSVGVR